MIGFRRDAAARAVAYMLVERSRWPRSRGHGSLRGEIEAAVGPLGELADEWGPDGDPDAGPKALARGLNAQVPVIYGAGPRPRSRRAGDPS